MKVYLDKSIFINRAPFDKLELDFNENEVAVLSAVNGRGKTTILSYIVDAFYEMTRPYFPNEFENKLNKLYRVSAQIYNLNLTAPSFVYLRFKINGGHIDYIDIRGACTEVQYNEAITLEDKIAFKQFQQKLVNEEYVKEISIDFTKETAKKIFTNNVLTYFPSYRYEQPGYLNDPYKINIEFAKSARFSGSLINPVEVISGLPQLANWIMDVILDNQYLNIKIDETLVSGLTITSSDQLPGLINNIIQLSIQQKSEIQKNLNIILTRAIISKKYGALRFGVGPRGFGGTRVQIVNVENGLQIYPSIFNISSGEAAMLCLFGELLRQADNIKNNIHLSEITGIIIVDEIDKHLHIKLQKEVLPKLLNLFPNVQFIISSHSPFLSMGLAEEMQERSKIINLDDLGISKDPTSNELYAEVYNMMVSENERFKEMYHSLEQKVEEGNVPLIITEGKTDIQHLKKAMEKLLITDCSFEYFNAESDSKLKTMLEQLCKIPQTRKIIGIFDRDVPSIISDIEKEGQLFKEYGHNVYAFCIPIPIGRESYTNISIEFYYLDADLKKQKNGKCLYFDNELNFDSKRRPISPINIAQDNTEKKIWCENIGGLSWIHSKARFAELVETDEDFISDFNFDNFKVIFDRIKTIIL